jgi:RNA polymerase sigma factor (sigma-70 family)
MRREGNDFIPTRQSLLTRLKNWDDQEGWREFFNTYWRLIYRVAIDAGLTEVEAQDVVQETVLEVAKQMPGFHYDPSVGSFKAWLLHTTRWKVLGQFKRRRRLSREVRLQAADGSATDALERLSDPASLDWQRVWDTEWETNLMQNALGRVKGQVSPAQFEIFYLHVLKEQSVRETARALDVSAAQVYLAKHRVGHVLKRELARLKATFPEGI